MPYQGLLRDLVAKWRAENVKVMPGVTKDQVLAFERRFALRFPTSFREYLGLANGMANRDWDAELVHFWTLDEIAEHLSEPGSLERWPFLPFADYSIECWVWALPLGPSSSVLDAVSTYGPPLHPCAPSLSEFIGMYLQKEDIYPKKIDTPVRLHWKAQEPADVVIARFRAERSTKG